MSISTRKKPASPRPDSRPLRTTIDVLARLRSADKTSRNTASARLLAGLSREVQVAGIGTLRTAEQLILNGSASAIELALLILPVSSKTHRDKCLRIILDCADSENWEIREYAAEALGALLKFHSSDLFPKMRQLRNSGSVNSAD